MAQQEPVRQIFARLGTVHGRPTSRGMPTRIVFLGGQETTVNENQDDVVAAVRRDDPNPVKLEGTDVARLRR
jgi:hypothetical protein